MYVSIARQTVEFLLACVAGCLMGVAGTALRLCVRGGRAAQLIRDGLFSLVCLAGGTFFLQTVAHGAPRGFHIAGFAIGAMLFMALASRFGDAVHRAFARRRVKEHK